MKHLCSLKGFRQSVYKKTLEKSLFKSVEITAVHKNNDGVKITIKHSVYFYVS